MPERSRNVKFTRRIVVIFSVVSIVRRRDRRRQVGPVRARQRRAAASGGEKLSFIVVHGPGFAVHSEEALHHDRINGKKNEAGLWKAHQYRLMARRVPAGVEYSQAGQQFGVAIDQAVAKGGVIRWRLGSAPPPIRIRGLVS